MLVVFQQNVVARLVFLDEVAFEDERFLLGLRGQEFDVLHLAHEDARARMVIRRFGKVRPYAMEQRLGLPDIQHIALPVFHDIYSGKFGYLIENFFQMIFLCQTAFLREILIQLFSLYNKVFCLGGVPPQ